MNDTDKFNAFADRIKQGDQKAGEVIFNHFAPLIYRYFAARTNQKEVAQDLTQDTFTKLLQHIDQFDTQQGNFSAWFWQIARNVLIDSFRKNKPTQSLELMQEKGLDVVDPVERIIPSAELGRVMAAISKLPNDEQELFQLHFISDLAYNDLAAVTGKSEENLRVMIHRLKKKIVSIYHDKH